MIRMTKPRLAASLALAFFAPNAFPQAPVAKDTPEYVARKQSVEKEFLARHPFTPSGPQAAFYEMAAKKATPDEFVTLKFVNAFALAMKGEVEAAAPKNAPKPSYWKGQLASLLQGLPFENAIAQASNRAPQLASGLENGTDKTALRNQQNFRVIVEAQHIATAEAFDAAAPPERVRLLLHALLPVYEQIDNPSPYTIFLSIPGETSETDPARADSSDTASDAEALANLPKKYQKALAKAQRKAKASGSQPEAAEDEASQSDSSKEAQKDIARFMVGQFLGKTSKDYTDYPRFSSEQRNNAIRRALQAFAVVGVKIADNPTEAEFENYLYMIDAKIQRSPTAWTLVDNGDRTYRDTDLVEKEFGSAAQKGFIAMPEGPEKDKIRIAAIVLMTQFQIAAAGFLIG
jgi:hypothetical protein